MDKAGSHGFSGSCSPTSCGEWGGHYHTFSYGIFEWVPKAGGKGLKKSAVKVRVSGNINNEAVVRKECERIIVLLDAGTYTGPKNVKCYG